MVMQGMEGTAYGGAALYGQDFGGGGNGQQLPYGVEDPRLRQQGGHYISQWQNPGGAQPGGGGTEGGAGGNWFS